MQDDGLTLIDVINSTKRLIRNLETYHESTENMHNWENSLKDQIKTFGNCMQLKQFFLKSDNTEILKNAVLEKITLYINTRFTPNDRFSNELMKFVEFQSNCDLKYILKTIGQDLPILECEHEYMDVKNDPDFLKYSQTLTISEKLKKLISFKHKCLATLFARIIAAKPSSADVERLISDCNILHSKLRSRISIETENLNLYIHHNMPALENFSPVKAISLFLETKHRLKETPKAKQQFYYKGIFAAADVKDEKKVPNTFNDKCKF